MAFDRTSYQLNVSVLGTTVNLVAPLAATERLVIAKLTAVLTGNDMAFLYIAKIPDGGIESAATALVWGWPLWPQQVFEDQQIVLAGGEGLAVGIQGAGGSPVAVFNAHGDLETGAS